ncbi:rare lipoprotein A [Methylorubrum rhodinum]|uniref:Endolytic peptidoglycan transglycosylase RlpA n=2 Tax=Methylorubrum rhodinum TaxID=29428 RepID=A0A840ZE16_9HYPH|nr:septal ring lytic transglycosylase RlpA family protein [Methylorubrum rhodinum]MBB5755435.1 rare lipoprotein A [Methylorubrum rhodinum]
MASSGKRAGNMAGVRTAGWHPAQRSLLGHGPVARLATACAVALLAANCAGKPPQFAGAAPSSGNGIDPKYGVRASRRVYNEGEAIPKGGGRRFSGKPYVVAGKTYVPREDARGYVREGLASWYGSAFHGRVTANGEVFDRHSIAAAHPTLPLPSYVRVTNLDNGYSMVLRVNDRGPYHAGRVMDVSEEAARALDFHRRGTARVRIEYAGKASIAGSDDRKLLASLRTDGTPASIGRAPVMMADLGPSDPEPAQERLTERFERPNRALAFKPADERDDALEAVREATPAPRPARPAPIMLASAASVAVPAAVQPTAARGTPFRPVAVAAPAVAAAAARAPERTAPSREPHRAVAEARSPAPAGHRDAPLRLAPPPLRLAAAPLKVTSAPVPARAAPLPVTAAKAPARPAAPEPVSRTAESKTGAMPSASKLAIARLAAVSAAPAKPVTPAAVPAKAPAKPSARAKVAEVY